MDKENLINGYFEGILNETERQEFEKLRSEDAAFSEEIAFRKSVQRAISREERAKTKSMLQSFERDKKQRLVAMRKWISVAAMFLLVGVLTIWWYNQGHSTDKLYDRYYQTFPNMVQPLVRGEHMSDEWSQAFRAYDGGDYEEAAKLFSVTGDVRGRFYGALSEMELGEHKKALVIFEGLDVSDTYLKSYILWYKALNLVKLNRKKEAQEILSQLAKDVDFDLWKSVTALQERLE